LRCLAPRDPAVGERIRLDRGSRLEHLGVPTPARRSLVRSGFSFTDASDELVLADWDALWWTTRYADVLFAVLDHYRHHLRHGAPPGFWAVASRWLDRVDNWAHADDLARVYSFALAADRAGVYPTLLRWNTVDGEWPRRVSIVSLIHYAGTNSTFLPTDMVLPLVINCLTDGRDSVQKAVGWVLREVSRAAPDDVTEFLDLHRTAISATAWRRATDGLDTAHRGILGSRLS
jgi:3-methyladenine DNA glycosylase AlkD